MITLDIYKNLHNFLFIKKECAYRYNLVFLIIHEEDKSSMIVI